MLRSSQGRQSTISFAASAGAGVSREMRLKRLLMRLERIRRIDQKLEEQAEFVRWWDERVGVNHGAGRGNKNNDDPRCFSRSDAESLTGITQQQVSKWRKALRDWEKYRGPLAPILR